MSASITIGNELIAQMPFHSASLRQMICDQVVDACASLPGLNAIILTGSMARDEASIANHGGGMTVVRGDAEFLLVFRAGTRVPAVSAAERIAKFVEERLAGHNLRCRVGLSPVSTLFLEQMRPHIFGYELRTCGRVVWGDKNALERVPAFEATEIPLDDAVRLLCNRMIELLELVAASGFRSKEAQYATVKLYLDMATSFLLFAGAYRPTYRDRVAELQRLAASMPAEDTPFSLPEFAAAVERCTHVKLSSADFSAGRCAADSEISERMLLEAVRLAHLLWRWELIRLVDVDPQASDEQLLAHWASAQPLTARLRGWVRVARDTEAATNLKPWMRWFRLALHQSPRQSVYAAGCQLFFRIPDLLRGRRDATLEELSSLLPVCQVANAGWPALAAAIGRNYHQFVEFTRT
jgi:hypothetical protein